MPLIDHTMKNEYKLPESAKDTLFKSGLSVIGTAFVTCFVQAELERRGMDNREVLAKRLRMATPEQLATALGVFDGATKVEVI